MILLVSMSIDPHTDMVVDALRQRGVKFFRYNTDLAEQYASEVSLSGEGKISNPKNGKSIDLCSVRGVWVRRRTTPLAIDKTHEDYHAYLREQWLLFTEVLLSSAGSHICWVNNPLALESAKNKFRQLQTAKKVGLTVPETWFTNSPHVLSDLMDSFEKVLYKQFSNGMIKDAEKAVYANILERQKLSDEVVRGLSVSPSIFQPYVAKEYELRITVVGTRFFAARIYSQNSPKSSVDWRRYDFDNVKHDATMLPPEIETKCLMLLQNLGLQYGAIDMIVTPEGEHVFLEVNANGQWAWIEMLTGLKISEGIADLFSEY